MNDEYFRSFINRYAISAGNHIEPHMRREWDASPNNVYSYNGGVIGFKYNGEIYISPRYEIVKRTLDLHGFEEKSLGLPFNGFTTYPGYLSEEEQKDYCKKMHRAYHLQPKETLKAYYERLVQHEGFQKWNTLVKEEFIERYSGKMAYSEIMELSGIPEVRIGYELKNLARQNPDKFNKRMLGESKSDEFLI